MEYRVLGGTGVTVSQLCLGAMMFGWGNKDESDCVRIIHRALDEGINFIDTADAYANTVSEQIVGKALKGRRNDVVLATKFNRALKGDVHQGGNSRRWIYQAVEGSLRRLGTDWIDLYQAHNPDPTTDIEETLDALDDLVRAGKVRYVGTSKFTAHKIVEAQWAAERRNTVRFVTEQLPYSMLIRGVEANVLPVCEHYRMGTLVWGPLAGGWLSGKYRKGKEPPVSSRFERIPEKYDLARPENQAKLERAEEFALLAEDVGMSLVHLAIRFVLAHRGVTCAIVGPRTMEHLEDYLDAPNATLDTETLDRIDAIVAPTIVVDPHDWSVISPARHDASLRRRV
jgi:aryl-alcohol dehydrogenase-like predicted oxidoreductase